MSDSRVNAHLRTASRPRFPSHEDGAGRIPDAPDLADDLVRTGKDLARRGRREEAYRAFTAALVFDPRHEEAWLWRAGTAAGPEEALTCLHEVLRLNPTNACALRGLAEIGTALDDGSGDRPTDPTARQAGRGARTVAEPLRPARTSVALLVLAVALTLSLPAISVGPEPSRAPQPIEAAEPRPSAARGLPPSVEESRDSGATGAAGGPSDPLPDPAPAAGSPRPEPSEAAPAPPNPQPVGEAPASPAPSPRAAYAAPAPLLGPESEATAQADTPSPPSPAADSRATTSPSDGPTEDARVERATAARRPPDPDPPRPGGDAARADRSANGTGAPRQGLTAFAPEVGPLASRILPEPSAPRNSEGAASEPGRAPRGEAAKLDEAAKDAGPATPDPPAPAPAKRAWILAPVLRLAQDDSAQYRNRPAPEIQAWARAACGAASFAALVNAADPGRRMTVGDAVDFLLERRLISQRRGLLQREDFSEVAQALNAALGREGAASAVNLRSPSEVRGHFDGGGGPIMFTGPSTAVWGVEHIYVAVGATPEGLRIVDSARTNYTFLTWAQWQVQTGGPGAGAGAVLRTLG